MSKSFTKLRKGDTVQVVTGKEKGKQGKILEIFKDTGRVLVEGVNQVKKTIKKSQENPQGGITTKEAAIHISNVMYFDSKSSKPSRLGYQVDDKGNKKRVVKQSKEVI